MKVRFLEDYDFNPAAHGGRVTLAYKAGTEDNVTRECAEGAIAAGKAVALDQRKPAKAGSSDGQDDARG